MGDRGRRDFPLWPPSRAIAWTSSHIGSSGSSFSEQHHRRQLHQRQPTRDSLAIFLVPALELEADFFQEKEPLHQPSRQVSLHDLSDGVRQVGEQHPTQRRLSFASQLGHHHADPERLAGLRTLSFVRHSAPGFAVEDDLCFTLMKGVLLGRTNRPAA